MLFVRIIKGYLYVALTEEADTVCFEKVALEKCQDLFRKLIFSFKMTNDELKDIQVNYHFFGSQ